MAEDARADTSDSPGPVPAETPGLTPGGETQVGDTPPAADSMSEASEPPRSQTPNQGPVSGNRTPMIVTLVVLALIVIAVAVITGVSFLGS